MDIRYPDISVQLTGRDGNALAIIAAVADALRREGVSAEDIDTFRAEAMSGDYDRVIRTVLAWVEIY